MLLRASVFVQLVLLGLVYAQEGNYCTTPLRDPGICVNIKRCEGLVNLLRTQSNNPEVRSYLVRSTCGYEGTVPLVCCPQIQSQFKTTSEAPQTQPPQPQTPPPQPQTPPPTEAPIINKGPDVDGGLPLPPNCGETGNSTTRVVGGVPALLGEFSWAVVLGYRNTKNPNQPKWLCGASLITDRHILTAAHCVHNRPDLYMARLGDLDLYADDDGATPVNIPLIKAKVHEDYSPTTYTNDIAILTLERKADMPNVWPVCLPINEPLRSNRFEKFNAFVAGWGALYFNGPSSSTLQKAMLPVVTNERCKSAFTNFKTIIDDRVLCAGYTTGGKDACQGDSGGPLMAGRTENGNGESKVRFYQIGVVSYGFRCAEAGYPGVYTRVTNFIEWIQRNID